MNRSSDKDRGAGDEPGGDIGGQFIVDGKAVEIDMAEWGWDRPVTPSANEADRAGEEGTVRLQKALANAGVASRRACETLITSGRVTVNGEEQRELGSRVNPERDEVRVDGVVVQLDSSKRYFVLNKPVGVVSTMNDEQGRPDLREFTSRVEERLYNVGRLDTDTSGLLILTNDGELAHKLAHPSYGVEKTYVAKVRGRVTPAVIQQLLDGVELKDGPMRADRAKLLPNGSTKTHSLVELTIHSGKNRIVRRFLAAVGFPVEELVRRQLGPLNLGTLRAGELRELSAAERGALLSSGDSSGPVGDGEGASGSASGGRGSSRSGGRGADGKNKHASARGKNRPITAGRPGDGRGAKGMRGIAARGNPNAGRGNPDDRRWQADAGRGQADAGRGNPNAGRGQADAGRGNPNAGRWQADEDRGGASRGGAGGDRRGDRHGDQRGDQRGRSGDGRGRSSDGHGKTFERGWVDNPWEEPRGESRRGSRGESRGGSRGDFRGDRDGRRGGDHRGGGGGGGSRAGGPRGGGGQGGRSGGTRGGRGRAGR